MTGPDPAGEATAGPARPRARLLDGLLLSLGTLTAVPVPPPARIDRRVGAAAMLLAPLAAVPLLAWWVGWLTLARLLDAPVALGGLVAVGGLVLLTRAMHVDGLADTADGLSASYDRDRALEVMKTGDVGPSGAAAIALVLGVQAASTAALTTSPAGIVLSGLALLLSRHALAHACVRGVPAARPGGLGALVAGTVHPGLAAGLTLALAALGALAVHAADGTWWHGLVVVGAALAAAGLLLRRCRARLGGITGDVLGACVEAAFAAGLAAAALLAG